MKFAIHLKRTHNILSHVMNNYTSYSIILCKLGNSIYIYIYIMYKLSLSQIGVYGLTNLGQYAFVVISPDLVETTLTRMNS